MSCPSSERAWRDESRRRRSRQRVAATRRRDASSRRLWLDGDARGPPLERRSRRCARDRSPHRLSSERHDRVVVGSPRSRSLVSPAPFPRNARTRVDGKHPTFGAEEKDRVARVERTMVHRRSRFREKSPGRKLSTFSSPNPISVSAFRPRKSSGIDSFIRLNRHTRI